MKWFLLSGLIFLSGQAFSQELKLSQDLKLSNLRCESRVNPLGVEDAAPRLSWEIQSGRRGVMQAAYRVLVSEDSISLENGRATIWDSKKVMSDASIQVAFGGHGLVSGKVYYWKVMVWDNQGDSSRWSKVAFWQTGLLSQADWKGARWIGYEEIPDSSQMLPWMKGKKGPLRDSLPLLRKEFTVKRGLARATAFVCGLGHFEMNLNGEKVGDHFLDAGWVRYDKEALYVPFDITSQVREGSNAVGVMLGNGFYYVPKERYHKLTVAYGYPKLIARIVLEYTDGSKEDIVSDASWKVSTGPLLFSSTYGGEDYDARREQRGWDMPGSQEKGWKAAVIVNGPAVLHAQQEEPLKIFEHFVPRRKSQLRPGVWVFDLGQNASGIPMIEVKGAAGRTVRIIPAELLHGDTAANQNATGKPCYFDYTLNGEGVERWHPRFMYYGFRYLQVEGAVPEGEPNPEGLPVIVGLEGWHTRNAAERVGKFSCSSELFRKTDTLIDWAMRSNMASVLTDCPHREKLGWLEQAHLMGSSLRYNYDLAGLYRKIIHDMMGAQTSDGLVPEISPEFVEFTEPFRDSPEWGSSCIIVPWYCYQWYGDKETLVKSYSMMQRYNNYLAGKAQDHILYQGLGDWYDLGPAHPGVSQLTPKGLTATAIWYYDLAILAKTARLLGKSSDVAQYEQMAALVRTAFNKKFFNAATKQYGTGSQTANAMAVFTGLVEPAYRDSVVMNIVKDLRSRNNALTSGDIGFRYLLKVLADEGRSDVIFDMNSRTDVPGYGFQLAHGATSLTESWQALPSVSNNHFMLGHIMEWFYSDLAGIRAAENGVGFREIVLRPEIVGNITWASGDYHSSYGVIASHWKKEGKTFDWSISIPVNTHATVFLPVPSGAVVTEGWRLLSERKDVKVLRNEKGWMVLQLGSGNYNFRVKEGNTVSEQKMREVYQKIRTPYKYGLVMAPSDNSKKMDCPSVFRKGDTWYMTYLIFNGRGYETWLAQSSDLLHWQNKGRLLSFRDSSAAGDAHWDDNQKAGYIALQDYQWGGAYGLQTFRDKYWMSYIGGSVKGYEAGQLSIGMAFTGKNPALAHEWERLDGPVLTARDTNVAWWDNHTLYKSTVIWDKDRKLGHPFIMYYNANGDSVNKKRGAERIGMAVSDDMEHWMRPRREPLLDHLAGITGDPYIQRIGDVWVMFYFGAFWKGTSGAFNRFACSYDLVNWTDWTGPNLVEPSAPYDEVFAHKSFVVQYKGVVYHFYCAVNKKDQRGIAVATSVDKGKSAVKFAGQRNVDDLDEGWKFYLGDDSLASAPGYDDTSWRTLDLPHDWSIEGMFSKDNATGQQEGGLPAGVGWYRKHFRVLGSSHVYIDFDGVYRDSEIWINGHYLGLRPNGYISFRYELTPYLRADGDNVIAVRVDNSRQPNSRWYTGSGIYRHVRLVTTGEVAVDHWGVFVTTPEVSVQRARVHVETNVRGSGEVRTEIYDEEGRLAGRTMGKDIWVQRPHLWSPGHPYCYKVKTTVIVDGKEVDAVETVIGIRWFRFDVRDGFILNGVPLKIRGVCLHHDLGALGAAVNTRAIERQLQLLKDMGCNGIRTSHNPPAPELLDVCDRMGFIVMDEAFDMWKKKKNKYDYSLDFPEWSARDLQDQVRRDRNHPSVFMWSIGNEIREQFDSSGIRIARELAALVRELDTTRPITSALTETDTMKNFIYRSGALDLVGLNYNHDKYPSVLERYPGHPFIASETMSALETRGHYDMPSDSIRRWPSGAKAALVGANPDWTVSAYDNVSAYWGSTHEETWRVVKRLPFVSGLYVWTGFDYLGEPTPYPWPARSSYFGIIDLAGFPKDVYYMYQSEWTNKPVLHIFPHWNRVKGQVVDVWAYYSQADEVELYLNGRSLGVRRKKGEDLHVQWRVTWEPGELKAVSRLKGKVVLTRVVTTAGRAARIELQADRRVLRADGNDLSFVTVRILDAEGRLVPDAGNELHFSVEGEGSFAGADNGYQAGLESFKDPHHAAYNGLCLAIARAGKKAGRIVVQATSEGLRPASLTIETKK